MQITNVIDYLDIAETMRTIHGTIVEVYARQLTVRDFDSNKPFDISLENLKNIGVASADCANLLSLFVTNTPVDMVMNTVDDGEWLTNRDEIRVVAFLIGERDLVTFADETTRKSESSIVDDIGIVTYCNRFVGQTMLEKVGRVMFVEKAVVFNGSINHIRSSDVLPANCCVYVRCRLGSLSNQYDVLSIEPISKLYNCRGIITSITQTRNGSLHAIVHAYGFGCAFLSSKVFGRLQMLHGIDAKLLKGSTIDCVLCRSTPGRASKWRVVRARIVDTTIQQDQWTSSGVFDRN